MTGCLAEDLTELIKLGEIAHRDVEFSVDNFDELCNLVMKGKVDPLRRAVAAAVKGVDHQSQVDQLEGTPFQLSLAGLTKYHSIREYRWEAPVVVVVGSTLLDFALYFNLSRIRDFVHWLPSEWLADFERAPEISPYLAPFAHGLLADARYERRSILFLSASRNGRLDAAIASLDTASHLNGEITGRSRIVEDIQPLLVHPLSVLNTDNFEVPVTQQFVKGLSAGFFPTPKPKGFSLIVAYTHRWITELYVDGCAYPRNPKLGHWLVRHPALHTESARVGARGICYECPSSAHFGGDVDTILIRPKLFLPEAVEVIQRFAGPVGWTVRISDKGSFSKDLISKHGGLERSAAMIRDPESKLVLWKYLQGRPNELPAKQDGEVLLDSTRRWYLTFGGIVAAFGDEDKALKFLDDSLNRTILHRGTILKCEFCRSTDWFPLEEIDDHFRCARCRRNQRIDSGHALGRKEPIWYYQLDEVVFQGLKNNIHVPLLTLDFLRRQASSFLYSEELEIWRPEEDRPFKEIDICCICDGVLTIGEAKVGNRIEKGGGKERNTLAKYRDVAEGLGAHRFVFATSDQWAAETGENVRRAFAGTRIEIISLSRNDLFGPTNA